MLCIEIEVVLIFTAVFRARIDAILAETLWTLARFYVRLSAILIFPGCDHLVIDKV